MFLAASAQEALVQLELRTESGGSQALNAPFTVPYGNVDLLQHARVTRLLKTLRAPSGHPASGPLARHHRVRGRLWRQACRPNVIGRRHRLGHRDHRYVVVHGRRRVLAVDRDVGHSPLHMRLRLHVLVDVPVAQSHFQRANVPAAEYTRMDSGG